MACVTMLILASPPFNTFADNPSTPQQAAQTSTTSGDNPSSFRAAPQNPKFQQYMQRIRSAGENYGYVPPTVDLSYMEGLSGAQNMEAGAGTLPSSFDWRAHPTLGNRVSSVTDQNPCGTCWVFGNMAVMESKVWISQNIANPDYSEQALDCCVDPSYTGLANDRCNNGGNDLVAQDTLVKVGAKLESCQPYDTTTINSQACLGCAPQYKTTNFQWVANSDDTTADQTAIKYSIYNYGPVTVSFYITDSAMYAGYIYYYTGTTSPNHTVTIIGWDDNLAWPAGGGKGAWLAKNSWGAAWGNSGYFWLCYGKSNATGFGSLRGIEANNPNEKLYYWDEAGWVGNAGDGLTQAIMANIFTASPGGNLTNVDFYTPGVNTAYSIRIYLSGDINNLGSPVATQSGTCGYPGYYSIALASPVALSNGQEFTVWCQVNTPGYGFPIPIEADVSGCNPPIQTGLCYAKDYDSDTSWYDLAQSGWNSCLRARVVSPAAPTSLSVTNASGTYGGTVSLSAILTSGSSGVSGEKIGFTLNGSPVGNATTNGSGNATLSGVSLSGISAGTYNGYIGASFAGDTNYAVSSGTGNLTVSQAPTSLSVANASGTYGGTVSLSAILTSGSSGVSGEKIGFTLNGSPVGNATTNGSGNATLSGVSLSGISAGTYNGYIGARFAGDTNYAVSSGTGNLIVGSSMDILLEAGWNMVSVPLTPGNSSVGAVFPGVAAVYTWDPVSKSYVVPATVEASEGYWVAVTGNNTISITGTAVTSWMGNIKAGWNMIGSVSNSASIANPNDNPDSSVQPFAYWWDPAAKSYVMTTTIEPGKGYWVASTGNCTLTMP